MDFPNYIIENNNIRVKTIDTPPIYVKKLKQLSREIHDNIIELSACFNNFVVRENYMFFSSTESEVVVCTNLVTFITNTGEKSFRYLTKKYISIVKMANVIKLTYPRYDLRIEGYSCYKLRYNGIFEYYGDAPLDIHNGIEELFNFLDSNGFSKTKTNKSYIYEIDDYTINISLKEYVLDNKKTKRHLVTYYAQEIIDYVKTNSPDLFISKPLWIY